MVKNITRYLELVIVQEKIYEERLSSHANFYSWYIMV